MRVVNWFFLHVIGLLIILSAIGSFTSLSATLSLHANTLLAVSENIGIIMMLVNGTFYSSKHFKFALVLIGVVVLGALMKILHLQGADETLLFPFLLLLIVYSIHFSKKRSKNGLDVLKLLTLIAILLPGPLYLIRVVSYDTRMGFVVAGHIIFFITFSVFIFSKREELFFHSKIG